jgi:replicative DNA helicase
MLTDLRDDQRLPGSAPTEKTILGGMMLSGEAFSDATDKLKAEDFTLDSHKRIFKALKRLAADGKPTDDYIVVVEELKRTKELDAVGGWEYIYDLTVDLPRRLNIVEYVRIVHEAARRRDLLSMTQSIGQAVVDNEDRAPALIAQAKAWLAEIEADVTVDEPMESVGQYLAAKYDDEERVFDLDPKEKGVPSGFAWQDDKTGGYLPGKLYIIAARPSMGKTAKAVNDVSNMCLKAKVPVAFFTFEQDKPELLQRLLCCRATANLTDFIKGKSDPGDKEAIRKAYRDYQTAPLYWDHSPGLTASQIRAKCVQLKKTVPNLGAIVIDQLSFMNWDDVYEKGLQPAQLIGRMTRALKRLARELHVPVILLCQLNRGSTKNKDAKPTLADLKESGSIEENADVVAFLHRAEYYDKTDPSLKGKGEYIIAKQRQGPVGSHILRYMAIACKWVDNWTPKDGEDEGEQIPW